LTKGTPAKTRKSKAISEDRKSIVEVNEDDEAASPLLPKTMKSSSSSLASL
jgi:hypothetical protein